MAANPFPWTETCCPRRMRRCCLCAERSASPRGVPFLYLRKVGLTLSSGEGGGPIFRHLSMPRLISRSNILDASRTWTPRISRYSLASVDCKTCWKGLNGCRKAPSTASAILPALSDDKFHQVQLVGLLLGGQCDDDLLMKQLELLRDLLWGGGLRLPNSLFFCL